jgi:DNA-binding GntR family transcriptional regulator
MFATTRVTLREALSLLEAEGLIYREDRRGWFIAPTPLLYDPAHSASFKQLVTAQKRQASTQVLWAKTQLASKQASLLLSLPPFSDIYDLVRVHSVDNRPIAYVQHFIRTDGLANLLDYDLTASLSDIYRDRFNRAYHATRYKVRSTSLIGDIAQALRATPGTPAMLVERVNFSQDGTILDCRLEYWRHDAISIESFIELKRDHDDI